VTTQSYIEPSWPWDSPGSHIILPIPSSRDSRTRPTIRSRDLPRLLLWAARPHGALVPKDKETVSPPRGSTIAEWLLSLRSPGHVCVRNSLLAAEDLLVSGSSIN
jgi:hypothetical protein